MSNFSATERTGSTTPELAGNAALCQIIQQQILAHPLQRIPFSAFMEQALYHQEYGYYSNRARQIGPSGDFFTAPHLGSDFGQLLAKQFVQMWEILGQPQPFTLVEMGAGQGLLATDILRWIKQHHPQCWKYLRYIIVEKATGLVNAQQQQIEKEFGKEIPITWKSLETIASEPIIGCCFSNELVDAFAVHQVVFEQGKLREVYVALHGQQFIEIIDAPSTTALADYFAQLGISPTSSDYPDPYRTEVNLAAQGWLSSVAACLQQGYVLTIDYGYPAARYYNRVRSQGTLQCYYQHSHHNNPYIHVGEQDITTHVNFTALEQTGQQVGLQTIGVTQQSMLLMALGLGDRIAQLGQSDSTDPQEIFARLRQRDALHQLINPMGLGNFGVLFQAKGLDPRMQQQTLHGLDTPISLPL
ncbi:class I SAM-dependent methyltransferase [filamentous cyanobacterium LEGE 11480]|uniref:Class I SAM-dependent methyltransferase n=1 Tax=Romeriopsis navalis LEGE 11480 TaxID=2777977 RepID=A0A928VVY7_9CYAN|nr:class I SAM-dependent methyltransferase [Romeriopsis navalis]MBE9033194.1 class I SAM-dependent methyltransferase [Romeriopsis navalis LEGE 11480]